MEKMTKAEFVSLVAEEAGMSKTNVNKCIDGLYTVLLNTAKEGKAVTLPMGTFMPGERAARQGCNPQTGQPMEIAARKSFSFKASATFKRELNQD